jgi:menaquinone-dependent protoporphyrinogen oxidase
MKSLIAFATKYGATKRCADILSTELAGDVSICRLEKGRGCEIGEADLVIIGAPIYAGRTPGVVDSFFTEHKEELLARRLALYLCCLHEGEKAEAQLEEAFPPWLSAHAEKRAVLGGVVRLKALKTLDRFIVTKLAGVTSDVERLDRDRIADFARSLS